MQFVAILTNALWGFAKLIRAMIALGIVIVLFLVMCVTVTWVLFEFIKARRPGKKKNRKGEKESGGDEKEIQHIHGAD